LSAGHKAQFRRLGANLIHCQSGKIDKHNLSHWAHAYQRSPGGRANDSVLGDRSIYDPFRSKLIE
jgi:hypothetical protein